MSLGEVVFLQAQKMVETMAEAFEFTYKRVEKRREQREVGGIHMSFRMWVR